MSVDTKFFYEDAVNQIRCLDDALEDVKNGTTDKEKIAALFRAVHTLKGSADMMGLTHIVDFLHKAEDLLDKNRSGQIVLDSAIASLFIEIKQMIVVLVDLVMDNETPDENILKSMTALENRLEKSLEVSTQSATPKKEIKKRKTILVVDDASMIRNLASKTAEAAGYNVVVAEDGFDGLKKLKENDIDFIFSDVNMPQMGGLEMVEKIRSNSAYEFIPIVMLTTEKKEELKAKGKALGVKAWLVKPFNKNKLLMVLEKLLG
jgi:two-component system chemotaxis response regulator CheY